jgi:hypothetical protein
MMMIGEKKDGNMIMNWKIYQRFLIIFKRLFKIAMKNGEFKSLKLIIVFIAILNKF